MSGEIGLDRQDDRLYRMMLRRSHWDLRLLAESLDLPEAQVGAQVEQLKILGLVVNSADEPRAFRAVEPALALPALAIRCFSSADGQAGGRRFGGIEELIEQRGRAAGRMPPGRVLHGLDETAAMVERLVTAARERVTLLIPRYVPGSVEFSRHLAEAVFRRHVELRPVWATDFTGVTPAAEHARWLGANGAAPHVVAKVPTRAVIIDRSHAVVVDGQENARVERDERAVAELCGLAEHLWGQGVETRGQLSVPEDRLRADRAELVLRLLSEGMTDDAVARRLAVSVRTIRNDVASTMRVLEAKSRFQAGVTAARFGLI